MLNKIEQVAELKKFKPVINIQNVDQNEKEELMSGYIVTEELAEHFERIFENITMTKAPNRRDAEGDINPSDVMRSFILRGAYGTGKSYFLLIVSSILEAISKGNVDSLKDKFKGFDNIVYHIDQLKKKNDSYFVVDINGVYEAEREFEDVIRKNLIEKCQKTFEDFEIKSVYENAINDLMKDKNTIRWVIIESQLEKMDLDFDQLISGLKKYKRDYLNKYLHLVEEAYGRKIDIYSGDFSQFIDEATAFVKSKGYKGIAVVFDEFSAYLTSCVEDGKINKSLAGVQRLAEETELSKGKDLVFITSMHRTLSQVIHGVMVNEEDVEKVKGRFKELQIAFNKGDKLIENTLRIDSSKYQEMKVNYRQEVSYVEQVTNNLIQRFYPIHTPTLKYLKLLSQRYAQENRTIFRFLADEVGKKVKENIIVDGKLNLITPDYVYDYFIGSVIEENETLMVSVNSVLSECSEVWQKQVVKLLVVSRLTAYEVNLENIRIGLSVREISQSLMIKSEVAIKSFLDALIDKATVNIYHDETRDLYEFFESGSSKINISKLIDEKAKDIDEYQLIKDLIERVNSDISNYYVQKGKKGITPVERTFIGNFYTLSQMKDKLHSGDKLNTGRDGTINFIIPKYFEKTDLEVNEFVDKLKVYPNNITIAVPKTYDIDVAAIKKYGAMKSIQESRDIQDDQKTKEYLEREITKNRRNIEESVKKFANISNFKFVFSKGEVKEFRAKEDLFEFILKRYYYKFPQIDTENISGRTTTNKLIDYFVVPKEKPIPVKVTKEEDRQIKETMKSLDLAEISPRAGGEEKAVLKMPEKRNNEISWEIFNLIISAEPSVKEKINILGAEPYGIPDYLAELYISCAVSLGKVYLMENEVLKEGTSANIRRITTGNFELIKADNDIDLEELSYTKSIWSIIAQNISSLSVKEFTPEKGVNFTTLRVSLGKDVEQFNNNLETGVTGFSTINLKVNELESLLIKIKEVSKVGSPKNFVQKFNNIPLEIFDLSDKKESLSKFEKLIENYAKLMKDLARVQNVLTFSSSIVDKESYRFTSVDQVQNVYNELLAVRQRYINDPFDFSLIDKINNLNKECIMAFNVEFRKRHQEFNNAIDDGKQELNSIEEIELIELFEKFNFKNVKSLVAINSELNSKFHACFHRFDNLPEDKYLECICPGGRGHLNEFYNKIREFEEERINCQRTIVGLVATYSDKFISLGHGVNGKEPLGEYINKNMPSLISQYTRFMENLNNDPVSEKMAVIDDGEKLVDIINKYIKYTQEVVIPTKPKVPLSEVNSQIINQLKWTGQNEVTVEEYMRKVKEIIEKQVGDKVILID